MATTNDDDMNYNDPSAQRRTRTILGDLPDHIAYDALRVEFEKAVLNNPKHKNKFRLSRDDRTEIMRNCRTC
jgi:hypothetical protein